LELIGLFSMSAAIRRKNTVDALEFRRENHLRCIKILVNNSRFYISTDTQIKPEKNMVVSSWNGILSVANDHVYSTDA